MSSSDESGTDLPSSSSSTFPNKERYTERILGRRGCREFLIVDHTANRRKNSKVSAIWRYGQEWRHLDEPSYPAMATQCERVFSAAKRTLTPERNALGATIIEACEC